MLSLWSIVALMIGFSSCVDRDFDEPPVNDGSVVIAPADQITISEIKAKYVPGEITAIGENKYMRGVVAADDESGNIFKSLILQDDVAGMTVLVDLVEMHQVYFRGREVFVNVKDLFIGDFNGLIQIGAGEDADGDMLRIPETIAREIVLPGKFIGEVEPIDLTINELNDQYQSMLVRLSDVQFIANEVGTTFADPSNPAGPRSLNKTVENCNGDNITVRNSGFADFASATIPADQGSLTAVYGVFGSTQQLTIRDLNDVAFTNQRCGAGPGGGDLITLKSLRDQFATGNTLISAGFVEATVISDFVNGNTQSRNLVIQDATGGIVIRFDGDHSYGVGERVKIDLGGQMLSEFRELLQVEAPLARASRLTASVPVTPREVTISQIEADFESFESTLVTIKGASINGGGTFSGSKTVVDNTGDIVMFTNNGSSFANDAVPQGAVDVTAIVSQFNDPQLVLRSRADVVGGTTGGGGGDEITIKSLRDAFAQGTTTAPEGYIKGIVTSDLDNGNITGRNLVIQDATAGIVVRFASDHTIPVNTEVEINVTGMSLSEFRGLLQVGNVPNTNVTVVANNRTISPRTVTVGQILSDFENLESTLVNIAGATITGGSVFAGTLMVSDGTGMIDLFTRNGASFANETVPTEAVTLTAIVGEFDVPQLSLRSIADLNGSTGGGGGDGINEDFESGSTFDPFTGAGWLNVAVTGTRQWIVRDFDNNNFLEVRGFMESSPQIETWVITPAVSLEDANVLSFESATAFYTHDGLTVWVSPDFNDVSQANWTQLNPNLAGNGDPNYEWVQSGNITLNGSGSVRIGFKYNGDNSNQTGTFRIDNVSVK